MQDEITRHNFHLARRIFDIMDSPGIITQNAAPVPHPGTINFRTRLAEAQRIHEANMILAARLDSIQAHYAKANLTVVKPVRKVSPGRKRLSQKPNTAPSPKAYNKALVTKLTALQTSAQLPKPGGVKTIKQRSSRVTHLNDICKNCKPQNVILEYTKVQGARVVDVAVIKEPFVDNYAVLGIDIDDGQKYEQFLTSEQVSSILEGDILVTSVDNVEVWMTLLNKITLQPVDTFSKSFLAPQSLPEMDIEREPKPPPTSERPSSLGNRRRASRVLDAVPSTQDPSTKEESSEVSSKLELPTQQHDTPRSRVGEAVPERIIEVSSGVHNRRTSFKVDLLAAYWGPSSPAPPAIEGTQKNPEIGGKGIPLPATSVLIQANESSGSFEDENEFANNQQSRPASKV